ncbi:MCP four helix bundle domain-containing protein [Aliivibrio fischeri]|uniref:Methyl-accepting chemotaxis protein n=1 Tax=Aliivibrio fischeri TaxID=668 RepID=A0A510UP14_ALIFS|nr:methyl-accepting chemotaxis protein [Aliivibrio fischeri]GEK14595.1 methyl-accepting chemotaxis protein [Aliivibrio fischeri]
MDYKNLTVQKKIATVFSVIGLVMVAFALFLLQELNKVEAEVINFTDSTVPSVLSAEELYFEMNAYRRNQYAALNYETKDALGFLTILSKQENDIKAELAAYEATVITEHERRIFNRVKNSWQTYTTQLKGFNSLVSNQEIKQAQKELVNTFILFENVGAALDGLIQINIGFVANNRTAIMHSVDNVTTATKVSFSALIAFMIFVTFFLARQICRPLHLVVEQSKAIAAGDLTFELRREEIGNDELGALADTNIEMQYQLRTLIENTISAVTQLSVEVKEMNDSSETSFSNTTTTSDITVVAAAIDDIKTAIDKPKKESIKLNSIIEIMSNIAEETHTFATNVASEAAVLDKQNARFEVMVTEAHALASHTQLSTKKAVIFIESLQENMTYKNIEQSRIKLSQLANTLQTFLSYFKV